MDVYVLGLAVHPAAAAIRDARLEEIAYRTCRAALDDAGVTRAQLDHVTLAACDELDGRAISSMLMAAPSGAYLKDELRVTDSGLSGLQMGALRIASGRFHLGLVASWNQSSIGPFEDIGRMRADPFHTRPIGMNFGIADGLFASAVAARYGFTDDAASERVALRARTAQRNPRAVRRAVPEAAAVRGSSFVANPLREAHRAPLTDGAAAFVLASPEWLAAHPDTTPRARITGAYWAIDRYQLGGERLAGLELVRRCYDEALRRAGVARDAVQVVELEAQNAYCDLAYTDALELGGATTVSPSGGAWAQNPYFCTGLVNVAEAVWQVAGQAGAVQVPGARCAVAHGSHGYAQQGHGFVVLEKMP